MNEENIFDPEKRNNMASQTIFKLSDDFTLVKDFIDGDERAFKTLMNRHYEKVRNIIYLNLGNTDAVDDISQDVFIAVYRKLKGFKFESQFTTWLYRITVNKCRDHVRSQRIRSIFMPFSLTDSDKTGEPSFIKDTNDRDEIVRTAIAQLPEKLRVPLILRDFEGLSYTEIAESLDSELGTIKSRIFRARENLKKLLEPYQKELL